VWTQLINELRAAQVLGRVLQFSNEVNAPIKRYVDIKGSNGQVEQMQVMQVEMLNSCMCDQSSWYS